MRRIFQILQCRSCQCNLWGKMLPWDLMATFLTSAMELHRGIQCLARCLWESCPARNFQTTQHSV